MYAEARRAVRRRSAERQRRPRRRPTGWRRRAPACRRGRTQKLHGLLRARRTATRAATCSGRPAGLPDRHQVRQRADADGASTCTAPPRRSAPAASSTRRVVRGEDRAGVPAARARHVRAAGPPERLPYPAARRSRRTTTPAGRSPTRWASQFDRVLDGFDGPVRALADGNAAAARRSCRRRRRPRLPALHARERRVPCHQPAARGGEEVYWLKAPLTAAAARTWRPGRSTSRRGHARPLETLARELGVASGRSTRRARGEALKLRPLRVGLWDRYGGSMPTPAGRAGCWSSSSSRSRSSTRSARRRGPERPYDVLIFVRRRRSGAAGRPRSFRRGSRRTPPQNVPEEFRGRLGNVTAERRCRSCGVPRGRRHHRHHRQLHGARAAPRPAGRHHLVERRPRRVERRWAEKYYIPARCCAWRRHDASARLGAARRWTCSSTTARSSACPRRGGAGVRRSPGSTARAAAQRLGVGPGHLQGGVAAVVSAPVGRAGCSCSGRRSPSARSRTAPSSSSSTAGSPPRLCGEASRAGGPWASR
jgi:hypothetical protein